MRTKSLSPIQRSSRLPVAVQARRAEPSRSVTWIATAIMALLLPALFLPLSSSRAQDPSLAIRPGDAFPGQSVRAIGNGFTPGHRGTVLFDGRSTGQSTVTVDRDGRFATRLAVPRAALSGQHLVAISLRPPGSDDRPTVVHAPLMVRFHVSSFVDFDPANAPPSPSASATGSPAAAAASSVAPADDVPDPEAGSRSPSPVATALQSQAPSLPPASTPTGAPPPPPAPIPTVVPAPIPAPIPAPPPPTAAGWREDFTSGLGSFQIFTHTWSTAQRADAAHVSVENGVMRLRADSWPQVGGMVIGPAFDDGYFEARIRFQAGTGLSPAFWLQRPLSAPTPWDEIDIMEAWPNATGWPGPNTFYSTAHIYPGGVLSSTQLPVDAGTSLAGTWHTYGARLIPGQRVDIYLDGVLRTSITAGVPVRQDFVVVLSHIAGNWSAQPDGTTPNPAYMDVDWVSWTDG